MDSTLQGLMDEHRREKDRNTMINHLLTLQEAQSEYYTDDTIKGLILVINHSQFSFDFVINACMQM